MQIVLSVAVMVVDMSVAVAIMQLEVSAALIQVIVSAQNRWVTVFIVFMQVGVSVAIKQVVLSAVPTNYAPIFWRINRTPIPIPFVAWGDQAMINQK